MNDVPEPSSNSPNAIDSSGDELLAEIEQYTEPIVRVKDEVGRIFIGPDETIESLLIALLARGHILLEGVPGVAKTTLVRAFARTLAADFRRVQFTPDLLPADITGTYIPNLQTNEFVLRKGPIFSNVLLGDEINRAPAKTQSALLEAMQERQVTIEGVTHELEEPFLVLATQNTVEQEGV
ncbi:MAG: AAA family ATPase, partial [Bradymonadaceae bacterium]